MKRRTYLDSGVLIVCAREYDAQADRAQSIVFDHERQFVSSVFVQLETLPKAAYYRRFEEKNFYDVFFRKVVEWVELSPRLVQGAMKEATAHGMGALDALHVVSAVMLRAEEFITTERESKPIHRTQRVRVISIARESD